tara:strand:- start:334 stop:525 length:192 start_codon:yes stop_codon:yes gene_type:complete
MRTEVDSCEDIVDLSIDGIIDITDPDTGRIVVSGVPIAMIIDNIQIASYVWNYIDTENLMELE